MGHGYEANPEWQSLFLALQALYVVCFGCVWYVVKSGVFCPYAIQPSQEQKPLSFLEDPAEGQAFARLEVTSKPSQFVFEKFHHHSIFLERNGSASKFIATLSSVPPPLKP